MSSVVRDLSRRQYFVDSLVDLGSPAWIRTTIHGSKLPPYRESIRRAPAISRPGAPKRGERRVCRCVTACALSPPFRTGFSNQIGSLAARRTLPSQLRRLYWSE